MAKKKKRAAKRKTKKAKRSRAPKVDNYCVTSKVKAAVKAGGCNFGSDSIAAANMLVHWYIDQACKRAKANNRKTVRPHDFLIG